MDQRFPVGKIKCHKQESASVLKQSCFKINPIVFPFYHFPGYSLSSFPVSRFTDKPIRTPVFTTYTMVHKK